MSAIKIDRWHQRRGKRNGDAEGLTTAAFPVGVRVSWGWTSDRHTHTHTHTLLLSVRLITAGIHAEGQERKMSLHFKCCRISDCSGVALLWKTALLYFQICRWLFPLHMLMKRVSRWHVSSNPKKKLNWLVTNKHQSISYAKILHIYSTYRLGWEIVTFTCRSIFTM